MRSICILDGDHNSDITNFIVALPGKAAPETVLLSYIDTLYVNDDPFWRNRTIVDKGYTKITISLISKTKLMRLKMN